MSTNYELRRTKNAKFLVTEKSARSAHCHPETCAKSLISPDIQDPVETSRSDQLSLATTFFAKTERIKL